jgi:hypothetical protein
VVWILINLSFPHVAWSLFGSTLHPGHGSIGAAAAATAGAAQAVAHLTPGIASSQLPGSSGSSSSSWLLSQCSQVGAKK